MLTLIHLQVGARMRCSLIPRPSPLYHFPQTEHNLCRVAMIQAFDSGLSKHATACKKSPAIGRCVARECAPLSGVKTADGLSAAVAMAWSRSSRGELTALSLMARVSFLVSSNSNTHYAYARVHTLTLTLTLASAETRHSDGNMYAHEKGAARARGVRMERRRSSFMLDEMNGLTDWTGLALGGIYTKYISGREYAVMGGRSNGLADAASHSSTISPIAAFLSFPFLFLSFSSFPSSTSSSSRSVLLNSLFSIAMYHVWAFDLPFIFISRLTPFLLLACTPDTHPVSLNLPIPGRNRTRYWRESSPMAPSTCSCYETSERESAAFNWSYNAKENGLSS